MNDWVVETPTFEEDLMNDRVVMLNQNGVDRVVEIIKDKDKEIERLKERENILQESFSDWKKRIEKERKYYLCERTGCCGRIKDSKKYSSLYQENARLNNIINELEKYIKNRIKDRQEEKQDFEEDLKVCDYEVRTTNYNEITIRHNEILELEDILDKLQELKGSNSNENL